MIIERLKSGVITVGHGRGFVVEGAGERLVITAAHCLPSLPPALSSFGLEARSYGPLLARRGEEPCTWAVCRFVDPIADIAVLGSPDSPHADLYKALVGTATALSFGDSVRRPVNFWAPARLLSLDGRWFSCTIRHFGGPLWITHAAERVHGGMSGSPIVAEAGTAIGVVCTTTSPREGGPNARLSDNLPGWLLRDTLQVARPPLFSRLNSLCPGEGRGLAYTLPCQRFTNGLTAARAPRRAHSVRELCYS